MAEIEEISAQIRLVLPVGGMSIKIVAVDGRGGSGKSTLAQKLAKELKAEIIQTDDFASNENPYDWWPQLIEQVLEPVKNGAKTISHPRSSWWLDHHPEPIVDQPITPIMILEGVSSARTEFRPYLSYVIWVETPKEVCLQRGLERDGQDKRDVWLKWQEDESGYIIRDRPEEYADIVVSGTSNEG